MTISDKILPIRFYDSLYDQSRFNSHCHETCQFKLVYPASKLPHFQLNRDSIFVLPALFYLRNVCTDQDYNYYVEIPEGADNFCNNDLASDWWGGLPKKEIIGYTMDDEPIYGPNDILITDCCKLKNVFNNAWVIPDMTITLSSAFSLNRHIRINVDKFVNNSGIFEIRVFNDTVQVGTINTAGTHEIDYIDNGSGLLTLQFYQYAAGDYFEISEIQAWTNYFNTAIAPLADDITLDPTDISVVNMKDGTDTLVYCNTASYTSNIPDGEYYYVIQSGSDIYYSEVFKIISLKEIEKLYKLTWNHDCDLNSAVLYSSSTISCTFENVLYLDANLIKPEYDTIEEAEQNGQGDLIPRFKRWQKNITLEVGKSPKFLTDALSAIFLHDNVTVLEPLNVKQDYQNNLSDVLKVTNDISDILLDCYQSVKLKLLLEDKITDTACCNLAEVFDCTPCDYTAGTSAEDCASGYYMEITDGDGSWWSIACPSDVPRYSYTLRDCNGNVINVKPTDVICYEGQYISLTWFEGENCFESGNVQFYYASTIAPVLSTAAFAFIGIYLTGTLIPNTFGKAYFQINCTGAWILGDTFSVGDDGTYTLLLPTALFIPYTPLNCICFKVQNLTLNCDFGYTNELTVGDCTP
jgi:hypothetical protein